MILQTLRTGFSVAMILVNLTLPITVSSSKGSSWTDQPKLDISPVMKSRTVLLPMESGTLSIRIFDRVRLKWPSLVFNKPK